MGKQQELKLITEEQRTAADDQIKGLQREIKFDIRDFPIDYLVWASPKKVDTRKLV